MNRHILYLTVNLLLLFFSSIAYAAFDELPGKRQTALGGAGVADGGDPLGFYNNPASSAWGTTSAFETQYGKMFLGLEGDNLSRSALGGYLYFGEWGSFSLGYDQLISTLYGEQRTNLGYAKKFSLPFGIFSAGLGTSVLARNYTETEYTLIDPLFQENGYGVSSFGIHFGTQWQFTDSLRVGLAVRNLNSPNQALSEDSEDPLPREYSFGATYHWKSILFLAQMDYRDRSAGGVDFTPRFGAEYPLFGKLLSLRGGGNRDELTAGFGLNLYSTSSGKSFMVPGSDGERKRMQIDQSLILRMGYTFRYPFGGIQGTGGHHLFGLDVFFDRVSSVSGLKIVEKEKPVDRVVVQYDTVRTTETRYVRVEVEDSTRIQALQSDLRNMRTQLKKLENLNDAQRYLERALEFYYQKQYQKALEACDQSTALMPELSLSYIRKGSIYYAMGEFQKAKEQWLHALELDPNDESVQNYLERVNSLLNGR
ncbi:tetratricopeptide repeat protein [bacterium]|nr:tetratricopeptide repeat protein [bacterium]